MSRPRAVAAALALTLVAATACQPFNQWFAGDFDGNFVADLVWIDDDTGTWWEVGQPDPRYQAPASAERPLNVAGDYDGHGGWEPAVVLPGDLDTWITTGDAGTIHWPAPDGAPHELVPVPADYDGDRRTDPAWYRTTDATWFIRGQAPVQSGRGTDVRGPTRWDIPVPADYDGDGRADIATYDIVTSTWYLPGRAPFTVGLPASLPAPADYDGDHKADPASVHLITNRWQVEGQPYVTLPPLAGHPIPVPADHDGDLTTEAAFFIPELGVWRVDGIGTVATLPVTGNGTDPQGYPAVLPESRRQAIVQWMFASNCWQDTFRPIDGVPDPWCGDYEPRQVPGDIDGDGDADYVYVDHDTSGSPTYRWFVVGQPTPVLSLQGAEPADHQWIAGNFDGQWGWEFGHVNPQTWRWRTTAPDSDGIYAPPPAEPTGRALLVPGDYDGDGTTERAYFLTGSATWHIQGMAPVQFGTPLTTPPSSWQDDNDIPVPADYDGDGTTDLAVYRPFTHTWHIQGRPPVSFGTPGALPVPADWDPTRPGVELGTVSEWIRPTAGALWSVGDPDDGSLRFARRGPAGAFAEIPVPADYDGDTYAEASWTSSDPRVWQTMDMATGVTTTVATLPQSARPALVPYPLLINIVRLGYTEVCQADPDPSHCT